MTGWCAIPRVTTQHSQRATIWYSPIRRGCGRAHSMLKVVSVFKQLHSSFSLDRLDLFFAIFVTLRVRSTESWIVYISKRVLAWGSLSSENYLHLTTRINFKVETVGSLKPVSSTFWARLGGRVNKVWSRQSPLFKTEMNWCPLKAKPRVLWTLLPGELRRRREANYSPKWLHATDFKVPSIGAD